MTGEFVRAPATARALAALPAGSALVLYDVRRNGRLASVDHVVVAPTGVLVILSVAWSGEVEVVDGALVVGGELREAEVARAADAALAVAELAPGLDPHLVTAVLCVLGEDPGVVQARDVWVTTPAGLAALVIHETCSLDKAGVARTFEELDRVLPSARRRSADVRKVPEPRVHAGPAGPLEPKARRTREKRRRPVPQMEDSSTGHAAVRSVVIGLLVCSLAWLLVDPLSGALVQLVDRLMHH